MIPGEGNIPIKEMLYEMKRIGYDKTATLELVTIILTNHVLCETCH